jgi:hypothetical protein
MNIYGGGVTTPRRRHPALKITTPHHRIQSSIGRAAVYAIYIKPRTSVPKKVRDSPQKRLKTGPQTYPKPVPNTI